MNKFTIYKCPVCEKQLFQEERSYRCDLGHSYDAAKEGYVNLLLANQMKSKDPGDSKEMMTARNAFLNNRFFEELANQMNTAILDICEHAENRELVIFDAGCGEGYYTNRLHGELEASNYSSSVWGMDISKEAVKLAAKRNKQVHFCVGSIYHLPILDRSVDCILNIFAPFKEEEFHRVLKPEGIILKVTPGAEHLMGLKQALYDNPYLNDEEMPAIGGFHTLRRISVRYQITLNNREDISNLLKMTPYYWNTNINKTKEFLDTTSYLETELDFIITILGKTPRD